MYFQEKDVQSFPNIPLHFIKTEQEGNLFTITLNRPEKRNAFTPTMVQEIAFALAFAIYQQNIWCVLLKAEGTIFCAGMDLNVFQNPDLDTKNELLPKPLKEITLGDTFKNLHKPSIAQVEGNVLAGGFLMICGCTFVVATEETQFGLPEVKRGIFPMQVMASLLKIMLPRKVLEISILGENFSAEKALNLGLVTHLSTKELINNEVKVLINSILENSPYAISNGMRVFNELTTIPENEQHSYLIQQLSIIRNSEDAQEGILAFKEKRKAVWKNR